MESRQGVSRYNLLAALEAIKVVLKLIMWQGQSGRKGMFLRDPGEEDFERLESEDGMRDLDNAMRRLRERRFKPSQSLNDEGMLREKWGPRHSLSLLFQSASGIAFKATTSAHIGLDRSLLVLISSIIGPASAASLHDSGGLVSTLISSLLSHAPLSPLDSDHDQKPNFSQSSNGDRRRLKDIGLDSLWLSELTYLLRPLLYTLLLRKFGRQSWTPWLGSLAIDLWSLRLGQSGRQALSVLLASPQSPAKPRKALQLSSTTTLIDLALMRALSDRLEPSRGEKEEMHARRVKLALYLLRPPFVDLFLKEPFVWVANKTGASKAPLLSSLIEYGLDLLATTTDYYTYTAGS